MSALPTPTAGVSWHSVRPPPPTYSAELMLNCQIVKVTISGRGPSKEQPKSFTVPRALLCAHSEYFNKACEWKDRTGEPLVTEMPDVQPWVFRVFLAFLFEQRLRKIDAAHGVEPSAEDEIDVNHTARDDAHDEEELTEIIPRRYHKHVDHGEEDPTDPTSWNFTSLFELYIFGDRYTSHLFRQSVFEVIQLRFYLNENAVSTYIHLWQDAMDATITYALQCLPNTSPLHQYLVDLTVSLGYYFQHYGDPTDKAFYLQVLETFPRDALAKIVIKTGRVTARAKCQKCNREETVGMVNEECDAVDHEATDFVNPDLRGLCFFHEHATQEEKILCKMRYETMRDKFGAPFRRVLDLARELAGAK